MISQFFSIVMTGNIMEVVENEFPERLTTFDSLDFDSDIWTPLDSDNDIDGNPRLHWFSLTSLCDLSKNLAPLSRQIRCKPKSRLGHPRFPAL